jgi:metal-sulfur cluster biosynthetic enzyme
MALHEDHVREALKQVIDPELFVNIVDLGLIYVVDVLPQEGADDRYNVNIEMTMTSPMCPAGPQLVAETKKYASEIDSVDEVEVKVVMDPPWTQDMMTDDARDQLGIF